MYNTLAARKQKNREAQASYKNRQTALVKHLGNSNEHLGKEIWELQQIHAATREECLLFIPREQHTLPLLQNFRGVVTP